MATYLTVERLLLVWTLALVGCSPIKQAEPFTEQLPGTPYLVVLGNAQDGGYPQAGCLKACCAPSWAGNVAHQYVVSLGLTYDSGKQWHLFEATPDVKHQLHLMGRYLPNGMCLPNGIWLTHGHMGHYTGLMHFGREAIGSSSIPVYAMPRMASYLQHNGPWSQLTALNNISIQTIVADSSVALAKGLHITPYLVPHRDEYTETVGFLISGPNKKALFIPDIDKWAKWNRNIIEEVKKVDYALIDATFFADGEIPGRNMNEIPHPFIVETVALFQDVPRTVRQKIWLIHFNHTNPVLQPDSPQSQYLINMGFNLARQGDVLPL